MNEFSLRLFREVPRGVRLWLAAGFLLLGGCSGSPPEGQTSLPGGGEERDTSAVVAPAGENVVARVNGEDITGEEFADNLAAVAFLARHATLEGRMKVINDMVEKRLLQQDARTLGFLDREDIQRMIARYRRSVVSSEARRRILSDVPPPTAEEVEEAMGPALSPSLDLTMLLLEDRETAEEARARILGGQDMAELAMQISSAPGIRSTGNVNRRNLVRGAGMYPPEVEEALFALEEGELSQPIETPVGYLLARLDARTEPTDEEIEARRQEIAGRMHDLKRDEALQEEVAARRREADVKILVEDPGEIALPAMGKSPLAVRRQLEEIKVAEVDGVFLTLSDVFPSVDIDYASFLGFDQPGRSEMYRRLLYEHIGRIVLMSYGKEKGIDTLPEVEAAVKDYTGRMLVDQSTTDIYLSITPEGLDEDKCRVFFEERKGGYSSVPVLEISHILVRRRGEMDDVVARLRGGAPFADLAVQYSVAPSAPAGGDLGRRRADRLNDVLDARGVEALLSSVRSKGTGQPVMIRTEGGYNIFVVRALREAGEGVFEDFRPQVTADFLEFCRQEAIKERIRTLRAGADIWIDEEKVASIEPAEGAGPLGAAPHGRLAPGRGGASPHGGGASPHGGGASPHGGGASPHGGGGASPHGGIPVPTPSGQ